MKIKKTVMKAVIELMDNSELSWRIKEWGNYKIFVIYKYHFLSKQ